MIKTFDDRFGGTTNMLENPAEYHKEMTHKIKGSVSWADRRLSKIVRMVLLTDRYAPMINIGYIHGVLEDGTPVDVEVPFFDLPKRGYKGEILKYAKRDNVFAKGLGLFEAIALHY